LGHELWEPGNEKHHGEFWNKTEGKYYKSLPEGQHLGPMGAIIIADAIKDMGALLVLSLKDNSLCAAGAKVLGEGLNQRQSEHH
jgi:hypothetical protein